MPGARGKTLAIIVVAQFLCTALWFAGNVVILELAGIGLLSEGAVGHITSAVQFGFIEPMLF